MPIGNPAPADWDKLYGDAGNDRLTGSGHNDYLFGGDDDYLNGGGGVLDEGNGQAGVDTCREITDRRRTSCER